MTCFTVVTASEDTGVLVGGITLMGPESLAHNVVFSANDVLTDNTAVDDQDESLYQNNNDQLLMPSLDISHQVSQRSATSMYVLLLHTVPFSRRGREYYNK